MSYEYPRIEKKMEIKCIDIYDTETTYMFLLKVIILDSNVILLVWLVRMKLLCGCNLITKDFYLQNQKKMNIHFILSSLLYEKFFFYYFYNKKEQNKSFYFIKKNRVRLKIFHCCCCRTISCF